MSYEAPSKLLALLEFRLANRTDAAPKSLINVLALLRKYAELVGVSGNGMVPSRQVLVEGKMFFDDASPQGHRGNWDRGTQCVITTSHRHVESLLQRRKVSKMNGWIGWRIDRDAVEQYDVFIALISNYLDGALYLRQSGHACG